MAGTGYPLVDAIDGRSHRHVPAGDLAELADARPQTAFTTDLKLSADTQFTETGQSSCWVCDKLRHVGYLMVKKGWFRGADQRKLRCPSHSNVTELDAKQ